MNASRIFNIIFISLFLVGIGFAVVTRVAETFITVDLLTATNANITGRIKNTATCVVDSTGYGDYTDIQSCVNYAQNGETVYVRNGTYTISSYIQIRDNVRIICDGGAIIKMADNFPVHNLHYEMFSNRNSTIETSFYTVDSFHLEGCEIDGNRENNQGSSEGYTVGVFCYNCDDVTLERLYVHDVHGAGVIIDDSETTANDINAYNNSRCGISFNNFFNYGTQKITHSKMKYNRWGLCLFSDAITYVDSSEMAYNSEFGVRMESVSSELVNVSNKILIGNDIRHNILSGISCLGEGGYYCSKNTFMSNFVHNNGASNFAMNESGTTEHNIYITNFFNESIQINSPLYFVDKDGNLNATKGNFNTINTGYGNNELYAMDQNVRTSDTPSFASVVVQGDQSAFVIKNSTSNNQWLLGLRNDLGDNNTNDLIVSGYGGKVWINGNVDLNAKELLDMRFGTARPASAEGATYYNNTAGYKCLMTYNSTNWICYSGTASP